MTWYSWNIKASIGSVSREPLQSIIMAVDWPMLGGEIPTSKRKADEGRMSPHRLKYHIVFFAIIEEYAVRHVYSLGWWRSSANMPSQINGRASCAVCVVTAARACRKHWHCALGSLGGSSHEMEFSRERPGDWMMLITEPSQRRWPSLRWLSVTSIANTGAAWIDESRLSRAALHN